MTSTPFCFAPKEQLFQRIFPQGFAQSDYHLTKIVIHKGLHKAIRNFRSISFSISEAFHLYFPRHQIPIFRGYAHCANTEGTASKQFPRATDQHPTGEEGLPNFTPHKQNVSPAIPLTRNQHLAPLPPRSAVTSPTKRSEFAKEAASHYKHSQMTSPKKRTIFPKQAIRNLRLQPLDAHQQALDGHQQALYGHPKPANGDFSIEQRK